MQWSYVGNGRGDFELNERYGFVGEGQGGWKREVTTTYEGWRFKPLCKAFTVVIVSCAIGILLGLAIRKVPGTAAELEQLRENVVARLRPQPAPQVEAAPTSVSVEAATTSSEPQEFGEQRFDCGKGADDWRKNWSVGQMDWCCQQAGVGCREEKEDPTNFDCSVGPVALWIDAKAKYCCKTRDLGCPTLAPPKRVFDCEDVPAGGREAWPDAKREFCNAKEQQEKLQAAAREKSEDCEAGEVKDWNVHKRAWCCEIKKIACPSDQPKAAAASAATSSTSRAPSAPTTAPAESTAAPAEEHDCKRNLRQWVTAWTPDKKAWCCRHKHVACPPDPNMMKSVP